MIYAHKKVQNPANTASLNAEIIARVQALENRQLLRMEGNQLYLDPALWKNQLLAVNWIRCLQQYSILKLRKKEKDKLEFRDIFTGELIGLSNGKKVQVLLSFS